MCCVDARYIFLLFKCSLAVSGVNVSRFCLCSPQTFPCVPVSDSVQKVPRWNFWKFLVNPEGKVVRFWKTDESMESIRQEVTALVREIIVKKRGEL